MVPITNNVTIDGGTNGIVLDGGMAVRLFQVYPNATLTLNNLQLLNGNGPHGGGAVLNAGRLIISNCIVSGNAGRPTSPAPTAWMAKPERDRMEPAPIAGGARRAGPFTAPVRCGFTTRCSEQTRHWPATAASGGSGSSGLAFGGYGGDGGNGGSAFGGAVFASGPTNVIVGSEFVGNKCAAGSGGGGGGAGSGAFPGDSGQGGSGGAAEGGAVYVSGSLSLVSAGFYLNGTTAGSSGAAKINADGSGTAGINGGIAAGGGLFIAAGVTNANVENAVFFNNSCTGGAGGSAQGQSTSGGNGGYAVEEDWAAPPSWRQSELHPGHQHTERRREWHRSQRERFAGRHQRLGYWPNQRGGAVKQFDSIRRHQPGA